MPTVLDVLEIIRATILPPCIVQLSHDGQRTVDRERGSGTVDCGEGPRRVALWELPASRPGMRLLTALSASGCVAQWSDTWICPELAT